jgi:TRAP-type C4-dicarboxylate transport system substrate-binding protein
MLGEAWRERLGAELISWIGADTDYYIFLREPPNLDGDGNLVTEGLKLRSAPTYRDWFNALGVENVMMQQSEVFSALERGIVDGFGWISIVSDVGVNRLLKARVGPPVWSASATIMANGRRFDALPDEVKEVLRQAAKKIEEKIAEEAAAEVAEDEEKLKAAGVQLVTLQGEAARRHVEKAHNVVWDALEAIQPEFTARIRPLMYSVQ